MSRKKIQRFQELAQLENVAELSQSNAQQKLQNFLANSQPILELACGKGEYTLALAEKFPTKKFVGIDIQGERLWYGAKQALDKKITNIFFLRIQAENLRQYFFDHSISEIWITFPDPFPRKKQAKKRLTSTKFLNIYRLLLIPGAYINLKTDDEKLFEYSVDTAEQLGADIATNIKDIYKQNRLPAILSIKTHYEKIHLNRGESINYLKFSLK